VVLPPVLRILEYLDLERVRFRTEGPAGGFVDFWKVVVFFLFDGHGAVLGEGVNEARFSGIGEAADEYLWSFRGLANYHFGAEE